MASNEVTITEIRNDGRTPIWVRSAGGGRVRISQGPSYLFVDLDELGEVFDAASRLLEPRPEIVRPSQWRPGTIASNGGDQ